MKRIIETLLKSVFFGIIVIFIILSILLRFTNIDVLPIIHFLFALLIVDIYVTFLTYIIYAKYLPKDRKELLVVSATTVFLIVFILYIVGLMMQNFWLYLFILIIGLLSIAVFTSILRSKRAEKQAEDEILL